MKNNKLVLAALPVVVIAAILLSFQSPVGAETLVGYGSVLALIAVMTLEYRINWRRVFGR